ncbi:WXG100 family type VII secretion target [Streptomyces laurentii]|uniref:WXG100 family type VII secretion target n=1 Tax=Streptomyces laurentii TaxID=39478 RepID=UPI003680327C
MSGLDVDTDGLGQSGENLDQVAQYIKLVRDDYLDKITSYHGCWGTGDFGDAFAQKYLPALEDAKAGLDELSNALNGSAQSLRDASTDFGNLQDDILNHLNGGNGRR